MKPKRKINLSETILGKEEVNAVCAVIDSGWLTMGDQVMMFERSFAELHGVAEAVAVNSCTAALHLALRSLEIGPGDEVLVPSLSFVATTNAVLYVGASPVFVDIESLDQPHISVSEAEKKITVKTKAVIIMHYGGYVADMSKWRAFCDDFKITLIEDAAHSPAAEGVGQTSDASAFSFFSNKNMSTAEGGMLLSRDSEVIRKARRLRAHGMSSDTLTRHKGHAFSYDVNQLGYNYRMDEIRAAIGLAQLTKLKKWNTKRNEISKIYRELLENGRLGVRIPFDEKHNSTAHLMPIILPQRTERNKLMQSLKEDGIQSSIHYPPIHQFTYYREKFPNITLSITEEFCRRELTMPLHPLLTVDDVQYIVDALERALN